MWQYIIKRIIQMIPVLFIVSIIIFSITLLLPGDITYTILGEKATEEQRELVREEYGLNDPIIVQYFHWLGNVMQGDLGRSFRSNKPVKEIIIERFPKTLELTLFSMLIAIVIGISNGVLVSIKKNSIWDILATIISMSGLAIPFFWLGILLILLFSVKLSWLPSSGYIPFLEDPLQNIKHMILPSLTIGIFTAANIMRQTRGAMLNILNQTYIDTAKAKGLPGPIVNYKHALGNAYIPIITVIGLQTGALMGGAIVTETVFGIGGIGKMIVQGVFDRDYPVLQGGVLVIVCSVLIINLLVDISYSIFDPRIRYK
jgi:peptide/nickel transport system permease protein